MGFLVRILAMLAILWAAGLPAAAFEGPAKGGAKNSSEASPAAAASGETASPATVQAYDAGVKAHQEGKTDLVIRAFTKALNGGGLETPKMALALYYRGLAYRKKGKPGLAISDLTSAIWLKDGLGYADQKEAMGARIAAYREAGISDVPQLPSGDMMITAGGDASASGWQTATAEKSSGPPIGSIDSTGPHYAPPAPSPPPQESPGGGGIGGFFSSVTNGVTSLFGGGSSSSPNPSDGVTTASLSSPNDASTSAASWSGNTEVAVTSPHGDSGAGGFTTEVATAAPAPTSGVPSGKYKLQIASVRSRVDADIVAHRLVTEHGGELGARAPVIDEAIIGSMGTFYRVRVGPYATADEPQRLCNKLQTSGFDCLVVTQ